MRNPVAAIAIVPSAPVMVPELSGAAAAEVADLTEAVTAAAAILPGRWIAVGVGPVDEVIGPHRVGTFAGYGVDVRITLSPNMSSAPTELPLSALITGWVRGRVAPEVNAEVRVYTSSRSADSALASGRELRAQIEQAADPVGVLVVADGAHTLTPPAPGGYDPDSVPVQQALDDALASGDTAALAQLPVSIVGRVAFQVLAGLAEPAPRRVDEFYRGAPYGVGYFVGVWRT